MPASLTSSFASAAAGSPQDNAGGARRGDGSGDWSRTRANGATQTFRRPSVATTPSHNREGSSNHGAQTAGVAAYIPPHLNASFQSNPLRNGASSEGRYSKDQLLSLYKGQRESPGWNKGVAEIFMGAWNPLDSATSSNGSSSWMKRDDYKTDANGPEVCWEHGGQVEPLGLLEMDDEEKGLFHSSVNSPLKAPPQNNVKDGTPHSGTGNRKTSVSQSLTTSTVGSPSSTRPGNRRRETGDSMSLGNPLSPSGNTRFFRDEPNTATPPPALLRRKTDFKDSGEARQEGKDKSNTYHIRDLEYNPPFNNLNNLKRSGTGPLSAGLAGPTSPWPAGPQSAGLAPMGAFGNFSLGTTSAPSPSADPKLGFSSLRGESRFKGLLSKDSSEDIPLKLQEKVSLGNLGPLTETESDVTRSRQEQEVIKSRPARSDTNPFGLEEDAMSGSAALGGAQDDSTPPGNERLGFPAFRNSGSVRDSVHNQVHDPEPRHSSFPIRSQEPMSPTDTNPYQSPSVERVEGDDIDTDGSDFQHSLPGLSGLREELGIRSAGFSRKGMQAPPDLSAGDRSQTSSVGPGRGFPSLSGLGGFPDLGGAGAWPQSAGPIGTPNRERSAFGSGFGDPIFGGSIGGLQSPSLATLGGGAFFGSPSLSGAATLPRTSKMGSLFPAAMQEQIRQDSETADRKMTGSVSLEDSLPTRNAHQPSRGSGALFNDFTSLDLSSRLMRGPDESGFSDAGSINASHHNAALASGFGVNMTGIGGAEAESQTGQNASQSNGSSSSNQIPTAQQRQMVMPDRMRWIYRDPQGNTQGPWSGLEMHDWFKAGFFTAELQVKKLEDAEYEPLAQLVRRIGNSREPFLVPQIGVPHGPDPKQPTAWGNPGPANPQPGSAQPPFASSFPSFGTTLTAEQQNALERRKQEEQYLMARQKEHLAQQQAMMKQMQFTGGSHGVHPHQLQHHSSAHSLHSQPSYGSITSPSVYQHTPLSNAIQNPPTVPGFLDGSIRPNQSTTFGQSHIGVDAFGTPRDDDAPGSLDRMSLGRTGQLPFGSGPSYGARQQAQHGQQVTTMLQDRARLQQEQDEFDKVQDDRQVGENGANERLRQFEALRSQTEEEPIGANVHERGVSQPIGMNISRSTSESRFDGKTSAQAPEYLAGSAMTLTQQVQIAAAAQQGAEPQTEYSPWGKVDTASGSVQLFPPAPSMSPLPAPAAQRRHNVADTLAAESRSQTQTPAETPTASVAPWAKESNEGPKKPSLKEIQEAEARVAAQEEEVAAAARRALAEQERITLATQTAPAPGLPSTSTWGNTAAAPGPTGAPWSKPSSGKTLTVVAAVPIKKTLAQIQKEEELRKQRFAAANATQAVSSGPVSATGGKSYANLAGKITSAPTAGAMTGGAWTTVGAGGKTKVATPATTPSVPAGPRSVSATVAASTVTKPRQAAVTTRTTTSAVNAAALSQGRATQELLKWAKNALGKGLNNDINVDDFVQQLCILPADTEIISDSVYANSQTLDGRRFAEEFVRRRKLADKGVIEPSVSSGINGPSTTGSSNTGGWSEVAKKGPANAVVREDQTSQAFKVVAAKKKGKK